MPKKLKPVHALLLCAGLGASLAAHATLGTYPLTGADTNVAAAVTLHPALLLTTAPQMQSTSALEAYAVNVVTLASGTTIKEYVSTTANRVFAVTWSGPVMPDLRQVLGTAFNTFVAPPPATTQASSVVRTNGLGGRTVSANGVVVHTHGVPGHLGGYAYIPADFPPGVTLQSLQHAQ